jgi:hypothetical protein
LILIHARKGFAAARGIQGLEKAIGKRKGKRNIPGNSITRVSEARTLSDIMAVMRESKSEGAMVTTRIPWRARSRVRGRVRERMAPLEAA